VKSEDYLIKIELWGDDYSGPELLRAITIRRRAKRDLHHPSEHNKAREKRWGQELPDTEVSRIVRAGSSSDVGNSLMKRGKKK